MNQGELEYYKKGYKACLEDLKEFIDVSLRSAPNPRSVEAVVTTFQRIQERLYTPVEFQEEEQHEEFDDGNEPFMDTLVKALKQESKSTKQKFIIIKSDN